MPQLNSRLPGVVLSSHMSVTVHDVQLHLQYACPVAQPNLNMMNSNLLTVTRNPDSGHTNHIKPQPSTEGFCVTDTSLCNAGSSAAAGAAVCSNRHSLPQPGQAEATPQLSAEPRAHPQPGRGFTDSGGYDKPGADTGVLHPQA